jgi:hypothetical protein
MNVTGKYNLPYLHNLFKIISYSIKMYRKLQERYLYGTCIGFLFGFLIIHPFSVIFEGMFIPGIKISLSSIVHVFKPYHLPMAVFFGLLGMSLGALNIYYLKTITREKDHIKLLEGLLPICSYCKKIRDDSGGSGGEGEWEKIEDFIHKKTDQEFTHGICPDCVEKAFPRSSDN